MPSLYICMGCLGEKFCVITAGLFRKLDIYGGGVYYEHTHVDEYVLFVILEEERCLEKQGWDFY